MPLSPNQPSPPKKNKTKKPPQNRKKTNKLKVTSSASFTKHFIILSTCSVFFCEMQGNSSCLANLLSRCETISNKYDHQNNCELAK